jgi:lysylphosphatidylglycerol synthetase-like protein (DUF2156 family)
MIWVLRGSAQMSKLGLILGVVVLVIAGALAPMPLRVTLQNPTRYVVLYPNLLFAVPLLLLGVLLLLYGGTEKSHAAVVS